MAAWIESTVEVFEDDNACIQIKIDPNDSVNNVQMQTIGNYVTYFGQVNLSFSRDFALKLAQALIYSSNQIAKNNVGLNE